MVEGGNVLIENILGRKCSPFLCLNGNIVYSLRDNKMDTCLRSKSNTPRIIIIIIELLVNDQ